MKRTIYGNLDGDIKSRQVEIRSVSKRIDCSKRVCYEVVYQYPKETGSCHYAGWRSYSTEDLPQEERDFYLESLNKPERPKKASAKEFKKIIQAHYPDCHIAISKNYGAHINVCLTKVCEGTAQIIFEQEGERNEILKALNILQS